jgi:hypothetical protein
MDIRDVESAFKLLPTLKKKKNPTTALVVGFFTGSIGLSIYFLKVIDFFLPWFAYIVLAVFYSQLQGQGEIYFLFGAVFSGVYGFLRATFSNAELARTAQPATAPSAPVPPGSTTPVATAPVVTAPVVTAPVAAASSPVPPASPSGQSGQDWWTTQSAGIAKPSAGLSPPPAKKRWWN